MKKYLFISCCLALMVSAATVLMGCSSSDDISDDINNSVDSSNDPEGNVVVNFTTQDETGMAKTTFKEGENIVFDLEIDNKSDIAFVYLRSFEEGSDLVLDRDFFCVYDISGNRIGTPWTGMFCEYSLQKEWIIEAHSKYHIRCPWLLSEACYPSHPLCKGDDNRALPAGTYSISFNVSYNSLMGTKELVSKTFNRSITVKK